MHASYSSFFDALESDEEENNNEIYIRNSAIYLIDGSSSMQPHLAIILSKLVGFVLDKAATNDKIGIIVYQTRESKSKTDQKHIFTLLELSNINLFQVQEMKEIITNYDNIVGSVEENILLGALHECKYHFNKEKNCKKYLYLITNNENPSEIPMEATRLRLRANVNYF